MAILTTMRPPSIQDYVFQQSSDNMKYKDLKEKIISLTSNRVAIMNSGGPVPMDIGNTNMMNQFQQFKKFQESQQQARLQQVHQQPHGQEHSQNQFSGNVQKQGTMFADQCMPCDFQENAGGNLDPRGF